jgi:hypothetical protein
MSLKDSIVTLHRASAASFSCTGRYCVVRSALHGTSLRTHDIKLLMVQGVAPPLNLIREWLAAGSRLAEDHI